MMFLMMDIQKINYTTIVHLIINKKTTKVLILIVKVNKVKGKKQNHLRIQAKNKIILLGINNNKDNYKVFQMNKNNMIQIE